MRDVWLYYSSCLAYQASSGTVCSAPPAIKNELRSPGLPYVRGAPPGANTLPPAATSTACPAAVSHSIVGPRRGYRSAWPAATRQNFNDEPTETRSATL